MTEGRYEIKFVLDENDFVTATQWQQHCTSVSRKYSGRRVHSIYFDDNEYQAVKDNLAGINKRLKIRLRWYENESGEVSTPVLQIKKKDGRLGFKDQVKLPGLQSQIKEVPLADIASLVRAGISGSSIGRDYFNQYLHASLYVNYFRYYLESPDSIRITIDQEIKFSYAIPYKSVQNLRSLTYPHRVMELKFSPDRKKKVAVWLRKLTLTPKRHSKYLTGLAMFGQVQYL